MAVALFRTLGQMEHSNAGAPLSGGRVYPQRNDTSAFAETCLDSAGSTLNTYENDADGLGNYIELDSNGRYQESVFLKDSDTYAAGYKFVVRDSLKVVQYTVSDIPSASPAFAGGDFAAEILNRIQVTASTLNLTAADAGNAYELDTTSGSITVNLPSAAATGNGKGFVFEKVAEANSVTINRAGSDLIEGSTSVVIYGQYSKVKLSTNGASWLRDRNTYTLLQNVDSRSGSFGGLFDLMIPASGHTLSGTRVRTDIQGNSWRIFENGGTFRGGSIDLTTMAAGAASAIMHSGIAANKSAMETATDLGRPVVPGLMHHHPGVAKAQAFFGIVAGAPVLVSSYNVSSITDVGTGLFNVNFTTPFSSANWAPIATPSAAVARLIVINTQSASLVQLSVRDDGGTPSDPAGVAFAGYGTQ